MTLLVIMTACVSTHQAPPGTSGAITPVFISEPTPHDTDDPAIWVHPTEPSKSLIVGTDKDENGGLYVFDLQGKILSDKVVAELKRPNNVDIEYGLSLGDSLVDIAVVTERLTHQLRVFRLPDMLPLDGGGFPVFENESEKAPMGIALYKKPTTGEIYAFVSRKTGPGTGYLAMYELKDQGNGMPGLTKIKNIGQFSGKKEIEAIAVDDAQGFLYYSDEGTGIRKYYADPDSGNEELALFGQEGFADDQEGISVLPLDEKEGYLIVSDQQANAFRVYDRQAEGHPFIVSIPLSTHESDGSDLTTVALNATFSQGLFVAMSDDRTFHFYRVEDLLNRIQSPPPVSQN